MVLESCELWRCEHQFSLQTVYIFTWLLKLYMQKEPWSSTCECRNTDKRCYLPVRKHMISFSPLPKLLPDATLSLTIKVHLISLSGKFGSSPVGIGRNCAAWNTLLLESAIATPHTGLTMSHICIFSWWIFLVFCYHTPCSCPYQAGNCTRSFLRSHPGSLIPSPRTLQHRLWLNWYHFMFSNCKKWISKGLSYKLFQPDLKSSFGNNKDKIKLLLTETVL